MRIRFEDATPGMILDSEIMYGGAVLVKKGSALTPTLINKIRNFGITYIDIFSEQENEIEKSSEEEVEYTVSNEVCDELKASLESNNVEQVKTVTKEMVDTVLRTMNTKGDFTDLKYDLDTFEDINSLDHSVRTAIFSVVLASLYNKELKKYSHDYNPSTDFINIYDVALAALLHDKGRNNYSPDVLNQIQLMTNNEQLTKRYPGLTEIPTDRFIDKYISVYSYCLVSQQPEISESVKLMILHSLEPENGTGPLGSDGINNNMSSNVSIGSKIIYLCSLYDSFLAHFYNTGQSFENIITVLGQAAHAGVVNNDLANLFLEKVPIYPVGAKVVLSNGEMATVVKTFTGYTYASRPVVKLLSTRKSIDLREETRLTISHVSQNDISFDQVITDQVEEAHRRK